MQQPTLRALIPADIDAVQWRGGEDEADARCWELVVAYDGTDFHGWQVQPDQRTVQDQVLKRVRLLFGVPELRIAGASRTDAGVHALDQHASFSAITPPALDAGSIRSRLNRWLPDDIKVLRAASRDANFHARHSAHAKAYTYVVHRAEKCHPLFARYVWHCPRALDVDAMTAAANVLTGEHDFASFGVNPKRELESTVRTLHRLEVVPDRDMVYFNVLGNSFLYKMVRSLVGFLVAVGTGKRAADSTQEVLAAKDRCAAADSAPPQGLFLARVFYEPDRWQDYQPLLPPFAWRA